MEDKFNKANRLRQPTEQIRTLIDLINSARSESQSEVRERLIAFLGDDFNDGDRIRICDRCNQIFWAGRSDMAVCAACAPAWRVAKHRARQRRNTTKGAA